MPANLKVGRTAIQGDGSAVAVNDVQTRLNETWVARVERPASTADVQEHVRRAKEEGRSISVAGGRHAQGGQQFAAGAIHLDMRGMDRILGLDSARGIVHLEAGIEWPAVIDGLAGLQRGAARPWGIYQKQTGANNLSLGGALAANIHGRGLAMPPIVHDVEAFLLVDAQGNVRHCSRSGDAELFRLAIGGYGLFGIVTEIWLRLRPRVILERVVEAIPSSGLMARMQQRIAAGYLYGDLQYATDSGSPDFLRAGVFSCYRTTTLSAVPGTPRIELTQDDWDRLVALAHHDRTQAFTRYRDHYLSTSGQFYDSDQHQLAHYLDDYHQRFDAATGGTPACEVISELYVPRERLEEFLTHARAALGKEHAEIIYGTIRLIEEDRETFLAWARRPWACIIVNLHTPHTPHGIERSRRQFGALIDIALAQGGSFYLTYHRWATKEQVEAAYPQFRAFLAAKLRHDPEQRFQSEWYRHYKALFSA